MKMNMTAMMVAIALMMGFSVALIAWLISRAIAEVPEEDRVYKDPPPLGFKLVWWPIQWISFYFGGFLRAKNKEKTMTQLRKAGLDYCFSAEQFFAARIVFAILIALLFWWIVSSFHMAAGSAMLMGALFGYAYPAIWLKDQLAARRSDLLKTLPFYLDIITLCVEAGLNLQGAISQAVAKGPKGALRDEFMRVLRDIRAGKPRAEALRAMAARLNEPSVGSFVTAVVQAESLGMSLGPVLRAQADQRRTERFLRAEKLAMEAPVKMLFPLIAFIFPCTFIVLGFPIAMKFLSLGL
jgi:tight adherence protein C